MAWRVSAPSRQVYEFIFSGRLKVTVTTPSSSLTRIVSYEGLVMASFLSPVTALRPSRRGHREGTTRGRSMSHVARVLLSTAFAALGVLGARFASGADATSADAPAESSATSTTTTTARRTYVPRAPLVNPVGSTTASGAPGPPTAVSESAPVPLEAPPGSEQALGEAPPSEPAPSSGLSESAAA